MSTIGQHISNLRGLIEKYSRTTEEYTDQFLYELLKGARNEVLKNEIRQLNMVSDWNWQSFCVTLIKSKPTNCDCAPFSLDCYVLKTQDKIPEVFKSKFSQYIKLYTLGGKPIDLVDESVWSIRKDWDYSKSILTASIINGYIYLWNYPNNKLACLRIKGVFRDPVEVSNITDPVTSNPCFNILNSDFPMELDYQNSVYRMVLDILKIPLSLQNDLTNDTNETIQA